MALQPVGPLPSSTYWRRRAVLLGVVLVVLLLAARACAPGGAAPRRNALLATAPHSASPAPIAGSGSPSPAATASAPAASAGAAGADAPASSPPPSPSTCPDGALAVSGATDAPKYRAGAAPRFTLTVHNTGATCRRALGPGAVELQVLSGHDRIWSSNDCATSHDKGVMTLPAGATRATTVQWSGRRSQPGCHAGATAQPGTYRVTVRIGSLSRQVAVFDITA